MAGKVKPPTFNPPVGRMPVLQFCAPGELAVDETYQRGLEDTRSRELIRRIAREWNWDLCQPLVVARRPGGALYVIDGQHRLQAARMRGDIAQLPCVVLDYASAAAEAASFVHLNQQRKPLNKLDLFRAAVASGGEQACAIAEAIGEAGLSLAPHTNCTAWKPGMVSHIGGIERAWTRDGPEATRRALTALAEGFRGQVQQYAGTLFRGIVRVCRDEQRAHGGFAGARFERFVCMLGRQPQHEWYRAANRQFATGDALFLGEAVETLFREEWKRADPVRTNAATSRPTAALLEGRPPARQLVRPTAKPAGFGHGAGEGDGEAEWAWCAQCDKRRTREQAAECRSQFCSLRKVA